MHYTGRGTKTCCPNRIHEDSANGDAQQAPEAAARRLLHAGQQHAAAPEPASHQRPARWTGNVNYITGFILL